MKKLNEEQMKMINGGSLFDTANDSDALYHANLLSEKYTSPYLGFHWASGSAAVDGAWAKIGVTCVTKPFKSNQYFYDGREISRSEALAMLNIEKKSHKTTWDW